jgi:hypothetical protein
MTLTIYPKITWYENRRAGQSERRQNYFATVFDQKLSGHES